MFKAGWRRFLTVIEKAREWLSHIEWAAIVGSALVLLFCVAVLVPVARQCSYEPAQYQARNEPSESVPSDPAAATVALYTKWLAWFTLALVVVSAVQLRFLTRADKTARISADAAKIGAEAAKRSADAAIAAQRPWMKVTVTPDSGWRYSSIGLTVTVKIVAENIGNSPATNVWAHVGLIAARKGEKPVPFNERLATERNWLDTLAPRAGYGPTVFPDGKHCVGVCVTLQKADLDAALQEDEEGETIVPLHIVGALFYQFQGGIGETPFSFRVFQMREPNGRSMSIVAKDGPIAHDRIHFWDEALWQAK